MLVNFNGDAGCEVFLFACRELWRCMLDCCEIGSVTLDISRRLHNRNDGKNNHVFITNLLNGKARDFYMEAIAEFRFLQLSCKTKNRNLRMTDADQLNPKPDPLKVVKLFQKGMLSQHEFASFVFRNLTTNNLADFVEQCPEDVWQQLTDCAKEIPSDGDENGWGNFLIGGSCNYASRNSQEEMKPKGENDKHCFRRGVRLFRSVDQKPTSQE